MSIVDKCFDNSEDGTPNYAIDLIDGTRLYARGKVLNPLPKKGDAINYTEVNTKTSKSGNQYTNVKDVTIAVMPPEAVDHFENEVSQDNSKQTKTDNNMKKHLDIQARQRMDIFVTGVVGRSMGSGHFQVGDIADLTKNAVQAFNENLKEL